MTAFDAVVVGAGPNGLVAAATLARAGCRVLVLEARDRVGGGARTAPLTLPGFAHDVCSSVHPLATVSHAFGALPLDAHGLAWIEPPIAAAHPLDDGRVATLARSIDATVASFDDAEDAREWRRTIGPLVARAAPIFAEALGPLRPPRHPIALARFGLRAIRSARGLARRFRSDAARALLAGCAAHAAMPLEAPLSAAFALIFALAAHAEGWRFPRGGAQAIPDALASYVRARGGVVETGVTVRRLSDLPSCAAVLFDVSPRALARIAGDALPPRYLRRLERFRHGPGVFKIDYALDGPIPWRAEACARASTVHLGGAFDEIAASERAVARGELPDRPYVLVTQPSLFDPSRAPAGAHVAWAYCHVPNGCDVDRTAALEGQIERFAPGFRDRVRARVVTTPSALEAYDANCVGGDVNGGAADGLQLFFRPMARAVPYATPNRRLFLCSASTPPGGGVHGMCGWFAARAALARVFGVRLPDPHAAPPPSRAAARAELAAAVDGDAGAARAPRNGCAAGGSTKSSS